MTGYQVITHAVRAEAAKWADLSHQADPIRQAVHAATLLPTAFIVASPNVIGLTNLDGALHAYVYEGYRAYLESIVQGGITEFAQIGQALIKNATAYENAESIADVDLNQIYA
jgi:hypothetical protein